MYDLHVDLFHRRRTMNAPQQDRQQYILGDDGELLDPDSDVQNTEGKNKPTNQSATPRRRNDPVASCAVYITMICAAFIVECLRRIGTEAEKTIPGLVCSATILLIALQFALHYVPE